MFVNLFLDSSREREGEIIVVGMNYFGRIYAIVMREGEKENMGGLRALHHHFQSEIERRGEVFKKGIRDAMQQTYKYTCSPI